MLDHPICEVMTARCCSVREGSAMADAVEIMAERKISELPVVDDSARPAGLIDVTDVVSWMPEVY
jgi:arabinose-5-phosphate isomerase